MQEPWESRGGCAGICEKHHRGQGGYIGMHQKFHVGKMPMSVYECVSGQYDTMQKDREECMSGGDLPQ